MRGFLLFYQRPASYRKNIGHSMSRVVDFIVILDDGVRKRHRHETIGGKEVHFVVQLEIRVNQLLSPTLFGPKSNII